jgi:hypothetical protein
MIEEIFQRRRDAVIILATDDEEPVGAALQLGLPFERFWSLALGMLFVHPV